MLETVLLKEQHMKVYNYPMGEVTDVEVLKGKNKELVKRHVSSTIPHISCGELGNSQSLAPLVEDCTKSAEPRLAPKRRAVAPKSEILTRKLFGANAV